MTRLAVLAGSASVLVIAVVFGVARASGGAADRGLAESRIGSFVRVEGGGFVKGVDGRYPEEGNPTRLFVSPFLLQVHEVTNAEFAAFVAATGYVTDAERTQGSARFAASDAPAEPGSWWRLDRGATWRTPDGAGSHLEGKARHPVVHVTLNDARAYAAWAGGRLPTEVEWEYAASLGLRDPQDQESGVRGPNGEPAANVWEGDFPRTNSAADGFAGTAPVGSFPASLIGTYDMIGNVWELTESRFGKVRASFTIKGGSFLCSETYCRRFRPSARSGLEPDMSTAHVGFRIVKDVPSDTMVALAGAARRTRD